MSINPQYVGVLSEIGGFSNVSLGSYIYSSDPNTMTTQGPTGPFRLGATILSLSSGGLFYLQSLVTSQGVTTATWILLAAGSGSAILPVANGGTGVNTLTGLALGNGTSAFTGVTFTPATLWTPQLQINGSSTGISTSTAAIGYYSRVGNVVMFSVNLILSSKGASTGAVTISNMPVAFGANGANMNIAVAGYANVTFTMNYTSMFVTGTPTSTVLNFVQSGSGQANTNLTNAEVADTSAFFFDGLYFTT